MDTARARVPRLALPVFLGVAVVLAGLSQAVPGEVASGAWFAALTLWAALAVAAGTVWRRPDPLWAGWALSGSLLLTGLGDVAFAGYDAAGLSPFPSLADVPYLLAYLPLAACVLGFAGRPRANAPALLDAATLVLAVGLPLWLLVGEPAVSAGGTHARLIGLAYPLADLVVLVLMAGVLLGRHRASGGLLLLAAGAAGLVGSDIAFAVLSASDTYVSGSAADLGWLVQRVLWGALALSSLTVSSRARGERDPVPARSAGGRVPVMAALAASVPLTLLLRPAAGAQEVALVAVVCVLITLTVLARLSLESRALRRAVAGQADEVAQAQVVAAAGTLLLQAQDRRQVQRAALGAVLDLVVAPGSHGAAALALGPPALLELVATDARGLTTQEAGSVDLSVLGPDHRSRLERGEELELPAGAPDRDGDIVLVLPLLVLGGPIGVLVVAGPEARIARVRTALRAVVPLVALALDAARGRERVEPPVGPRGGPAACTAPVRTASARAALPGFVSELARGLRRGEFVAHYQPIVDLGDGRPRGFEALVRWDHPERGLLMPGSFLPEVERCGLQAQLDLEVMRQACRQAVRFDRRADGPYVAVNTSAAQLLDPRFPTLVRAALADRGLAPWRLVLEVTETASVVDPIAVAAVLERVRRMRCRVAFDDFGTGYSSLSWLQQLPLDIVKIDKTFVDRLPVRPGDRPVVEALVRLTQTLGLDVVAEGVETEEQRLALQSMGVRLAQGWLFSRALPAARAEQLLRDSRAVPERGGELLQLRSS